MRILALDIGEKRIGLAISDELGVIATPHGFVERKKAKIEIPKVIGEEKVGKIVVGVPYLASGELGSQADDVWKFVEELKAMTPVEIEYENEILTSVEAEERLKTVKKKTKGDVDAMAAVIILESYLKREGNE